MADAELPRFDAAALRALAESWDSDAAAACAACRPLICQGWESWPATADPQALQRIGSLRDASIDDPTLDEHHPAGTNAWAPLRPSPRPSTPTTAATSGSAATAPGPSCATRSTAGTTRTSGYVN